MTSEDLIALPWCSAQMTYSKWWMTIRNVWYTYRLPSPLFIPDMQVEWLEGLTLAAEASVDMVTRCLGEEWDLRVFPRAVGVALVLCFHTLSMGATHLRHYHPQLPTPAFLDISHSLARLQARINSGAVSLRTMMGKAEKTLDEYNRQIVTQAHRDSEEGRENPFLNTSQQRSTEHQPPFTTSYDYTLNSDIGFDLEGGNIGQGIGGFDPTQQAHGFGNGMGQTGIGYLDPLMGFGDAWGFQQSTDTPFWHR